MKRKCNSFFIITKKCNFEKHFFLFVKLKIPIAAVVPGPIDFSVE